MGMTPSHILFAGWHGRLLRMLRVSRPLLIGAAIFAFLGHSGPSIAQQNNDASTVAVVNLAKEHKQKSMAGLLHGAFPADVPLERAKAMAPQIWRGRAELVDAAAKIGTKFVMATSFERNITGQFTHMPYGNDIAHPDWTEYETWLTDLVRKNKDHVAYWEFWNEPDSNRYWPRASGESSKCEEPFTPPDRLFESYEHFYKIIRREAGPDVSVTAPSLGSYCLPFLRAFMRYAADHDLEVNALGWHELHQPNDDRSLVERHLKEARAEFFYDPKRPSTFPYRKLKLTEIQINESSGPEDQFHPGEAAAYLYFLERGGADNAARACWPDMAAPGQKPGGCSNNTIDSVLAPDLTPGQPQHQPRGAWWVYKQYADMQAHRFMCAQTWKHAMCLAGVNAAGEPRLVVGQYGYGNMSVAGLKIRLDGLAQSPALAGAAKVHVSVTQAVSGPQAQPDLGPPTEFDAPVVAGHVTLNLPRLMGHSALLVNVSRAGN